VWTRHTLVVRRHGPAMTGDNRIHSRPGPDNGGASVHRQGVGVGLFDIGQRAWGSTA
jgi:hypothetical protein